jgi:hypothetical protein
MHKLRWIGTALALALAWMPARADIDIFIKPVLTLDWRSCSVLEASR